MNSITVRTLREKLANKELLYILDLRDGKDFRAGHIPDAQNRPLQVLNPLDIKRQFQEDFLGDTLIVLYSDKENKATKAYKLLESAGLKNICYLEGGYHDWILIDKAVKQIESEQKLEYIEKTNAKEAKKVFTWDLLGLLLILIGCMGVIIIHEYMLIIPMIFSSLMLYLKVRNKPTP